jgi:hypothetical protein
VRLPVDKAKQLKRRFIARLEQPPAFTAGEFTNAPLTQSVVGASGGTITVSDPASPVNGLTIKVPPGATEEDITFTVSTADIVSANGLREGAFPTSKLIHIQASGSDYWNEYRMLNVPALVTLPYQPPAEGEEMVRFYAIKPDGSLEAAGFAAQDMEKKTVSFYLRAFGDTAPPSRLELSEAAGSAGLMSGAPDTPPAAAAMPSSAPPPAPTGSPAGITLLGVGLTLPTPATVPDPATARIFKPSVNGWYIPNAGSGYFLNSGGSCLGIIATAKHYFQRSHTPDLVKAYLDNWPDWNTKVWTNEWQDDKVAIEYTSRAQKDVNGVFEFFGNKLENPAGARATMLTMVGALYVTRLPILMGIQEGWIDYALTALWPPLNQKNHAVMVYQADVPARFNGPVEFKVYDPNYPRNDHVTITWNPAEGFEPYTGAPNDPYDDVMYNTFNMLGYYTAVTDAQLDRLKVAADRGFKASVFPTITLDSITGKNNNEVVYDRASGVLKQGTTETGDHKYITSDSAVVIRGTITGGIVQSACCWVNNAVVFMATNTLDRVVNTPVNNSPGGGDGSFEVTVPVGYGERELAILGGTYEPAKNILSPATFRQWSAFYRDILESTAPSAALTIKLDWDQTLSDVDLYVKEPNATDGSGKTGDTVYYSNRVGVSATHPYLEVDNTSGKGPEHYRAQLGMKTLYTDGTEAPDLFGDYTVKVHYFADRDNDQSKDQRITWKVSWRYLADCPEPCLDPEKDGLWKEDSRSNMPILTTANSGNCCNIGNGEPDWSSPITIPYPNPRAGRLFNRPRTVNLP